jgi:hypothetical protein
MVDRLDVTLPVRCDQRGRWSVADQAGRVVFSEHWNATDAERAAWNHVRSAGGLVIVHDRYGRTHEARSPAGNAGREGSER